MKHAAAHERTARGLAALASSALLGLAAAARPGNSDEWLVSCVIRANLSAETLCLAASGQAIDACATTPCDSNLAISTAAANAALVDVVANRAALSATARDACANEAEVSAAAAAIDEALLSRDEHRLALRSHVLGIIAADLSAESRARIERMIANRERKVPAHLRCLQLDEQGWLRLELACAKRAAGTTLSQEEISLLAAAESHQDAQFVAARIEAHAASIEVVLNQRFAEAIATPQAPVP